MNDLGLQSLIDALPAWVSGVRFFPETDSTNRRAMLWATEGAAHGSLVVADFQTAGRGRMGRDWVAPPGSGLLVSIVLRPRLEPDLHPLLGLAAGVAVCECLAGMGLEPGLKWPNDVLLAGRKVSGILAEAAPGVVVLGIGVNIGLAVMPAEIASTSIGVEEAAGGQVDRLEVLAGLIGHLAPLVDGPPDQVISRYRDWCRTLGRRVRVDLGSGLVEDLAVDVDAGGSLVLAGGAVIRAGDVTQLR